MSQQTERPEPETAGDGDGGQSTPRDETAVTTVDVRCTGHVRTEVGNPRFEYSFEGGRLRDFLEAFFEEYDVEHVLIAETESEATTEGWVPEMEDLPGNQYAKNPEGEQTRCYARILVNGTFNEHLDGLDTRVQEGDRIALMYPFMYCC